MFEALVSALLLVAPTLTSASAFNAGDLEIMLSTATVTSAQKTSVTGTWTLTYRPKQGSSGRVDLRLKQTGNRVQVSSYFYVGGRSGAWYNDRDGKIQGNRITLYFEEKGETATYTGTINGNTMSGTMSFGGSWTARRL